MAAFQRPPHQPRCPFCGETLEDLMLAFLDHVDHRPVCRYLWMEWRGNVKREAGGT